LPRKCQYLLKASGTDRSKNEEPFCGKPNKQKFHILLPEQLGLGLLKVNIAAGYVFTLWFSYDLPKRKPRGSSVSLCLEMNIYLVKM
jgi:hypothetical protein